MPALRVLPALLLLLAPTGGSAHDPDADCDGVPDALDAYVGVCAESAPMAPAPRLVAVVAFVEPAASAAPPLDLAPLARAFEDATGGRASARLVELPRALPAPTGVRALEDAPATLAARALADPAAPRDADLVVLLSRGLPAGERCGCVAWSVPVDARGAASFGGSPHLRAVMALGDPSSTSAGELAFRFLHELGHASCCRLDGPAVALTDGAGHWRVGFDARDPLNGDGSAGRPTEAARYALATLALMRIVPPRDVPPVALPSGKLLSGADLLALAHDGA